MATLRAITQYQTTNKATALDDAIREVQIRVRNELHCFEPVVNRYVLHSVSVCA